MHPQVTRKHDLLLTKEQRDKCLAEIIEFFKEKREEQIGLIAAEEILDFLILIAGEHIYNKGLSDARKTIKKNQETLDVDLDLLNIN